MNRAAALFLLLMVLSPAWAEDKPAEQPQTLTPEQAADAVLEAFKAKDNEALKALVEKDEPDPWLVADELIRQGEADAALALSRAGADKGAGALSAYVEQRRSAPPDTEALSALRRAEEALQGGAGEAALAALQAIAVDGSSVLGVDRELAIGRALRQLRRFPDSTVAFLRGAERAKALDWMSGEAAALHDAGISAAYSADFQSALRYWLRMLTIEEGRSYVPGSAVALQNIGNAYYSLGNHAEAIAYLERALASYEQLGRRGSAGRTLGSLGLVHLALGDRPKAREYLERALAIHEKLGNRSSQAHALRTLGVIHYALEEMSMARARLEASLEISEELGDTSGTAQALGHLAVLHERLGEHAEALALLVRALAVHEAGGRRLYVAQTLESIARIHFRRGDYEKARSCNERSLALSEALGVRPQIARVLRNLGEVHFRTGEYPEALGYLERALGIQEEMGERPQVAGTLLAIGNIQYAIGDFPRARASYERSLHLKREIGGQASAAYMVSSLGNVHYALGDFAQALAHYERALRAHEKLGDRGAAAAVLANLGSTHLRLGDYPEALSSLERAFAIQEELGERQMTAGILGNIGQAYELLGDYPKAQAYQERALGISEAIGEPRGVAQRLASLGTLHYNQGDNAQALALQQRALELYEAIGERPGVAVALGTLGVIHTARGDHARALDYQRRALALREALGDRASVAGTLADLGILHQALGDTPKAIQFLQRAARTARRLRLRHLEMLSHTHLARVHLQGGEYARALMSAQRALRELEGLLGGLGEEEGAAAREQFMSLFAVGALAAAKLDEPAEVLTFLESGRAGSLLEMLSGGRASRFADLPAALLQAEAEAKAQEARARYDHARALDGGTLREVRRAARAVDEAMEVRREVGARAQREAKRVAGVFYPRAATLEELQGWLDSETAFVLYGLCIDEALALVVTAEDARIVSLGLANAIRADAAALVCDDPSVDPAGALTALRARVVVPLALGGGIKTVLVSPDGVLGYQPWGALFNRTVACVPSGTTWALLRDEEREVGTMILALGDPDYGSRADDRAVKIYTRGRRLIQLPATRAEAKAVGDLVLLAEEATEFRLVEALAKEDRWRAVHLACHGLVNAEQPTLSSLAITADQKSDGFLNCLDIVRMKISADLVVLSACETGKGKIYKTEGIVGLTRAFMFAGSPRVICSLWKVDDKATQALMVKFYELWNPKPEALSERSESKGDGKKGLGAAAALKKAQAYVRDFKDERGQQKWKHPYYWAAWVLWGLPE